MNYGHTLAFGTFITPRSDAPERVVALAQRSEALGYSLVSFQDHPYQPALLDAWTLLAWVAGRTERIQIAPNVLNLPLRQPAVLARAAISLDRLSGGRLALGLGAGAFWDGIKAMGGWRLAPGEAVGALGEAIDIVRGMLDTSERGPLQLDGDYYAVAGAERGPTPAHDIPIWVGAYKPRMLRLLAQKADGWLPSLGYIQPHEIAAANATIDQAAREAGRDPREIRRLLNISGQFTAQRGGFLKGTSQQWVEDLLPLVVEHGISTLILMADDVEVMEQFMAEVAPPLREAALAAAPQGAAGPVRRAAALAKRRQGIDYDRIPAALREAAVEPGDIAFARVRSTYMRRGAPGLVLRPSTPDQVAQALAFARTQQGVPLGIRSGGHGISGRSTNDGGIIISLDQMNSIEVIDRAARRVRLGPAARWMDVAAALEPYGWAISSGDYGGVGVGGLATAGGIGWMARKHGLTIDHVRAVDVVLADGSQVRASQRENPDLFWAMRGAGANFGIATAFELEADAVGRVGWAQLVMDASDTAGLLQRWGAAVEAAPRDLTSAIILGPPRRGQPPIAQVMAMVDSDDPDTIIRQLQPLADIAPMYDQSVVLTSYASVMANADPADHDGQGEPLGRAGLLGQITPAFAADAARLLQSGVVYFFHIRALGGAVADVPAEATAYAHRQANFSVNAFGTSRLRLDALWDGMARHFQGLYLNFETDLRPERVAEAFPPATLARLRDLKRRYDPENVFRDNFNIAPQQEGA